MEQTIVLNQRPKATEESKWQNSYDYVLSLDPAKSADWFGVALFKFVEDKYLLEALTRWKMLSYADALTRIISIVQRLHGRVCIFVDRGGPGEPFIDLLEQEIGQTVDVFAIQITGGYTPKQTGRVFSVPKSSLVYTSQVIIENQRLIVPSNLKHWEEATAEFEVFSAKSTPSGDTLAYEALRSGQHDDLVLAVIMGLWLCEKVFPASKTASSGSQTDVYSSPGVMYDVDSQFLSQPEFDEMLNDPSGNFTPGLPNTEDCRRKLRGTEVW